MSYQEVSTMPMPEVMRYWHAIDMLEAQETILNLKISEYSSMEAEDKKKLLDELKAKAYFKEDIVKQEENVIMIKTSQLAGLLSGA